MNVTNVIKSTQKDLNSCNIFPWFMKRRDYSNALYVHEVTQVRKVLYNMQMCIPISDHIPVQYVRTNLREAITWWPTWKQFITLPKKIGKSQTFESCGELLPLFFCKEREAANLTPQKIYPCQLMHPLYPFDLHAF